MARALRMLLLGALVSTSIATLPAASAPAFASELDKKGKSDAKEAMRFYKEGNYEDAARLFLRLSMSYPDMLVFVRNLGACYYYMRRYEPALSNLRDYLHRKTDIPADDRAEVAGWIGEMERLRDQASAPPPAAVAPAPVPAPPPVAPTEPPAASPPAAGEGTTPAPSAGAPVPVPPVPMPGAAGAVEPGAAPAPPSTPAPSPTPAPSTGTAPDPTPAAAPPPPPSFPAGAPAEVTPPAPPASGAPSAFPPQYPTQGAYPAQPGYPAQGAYPQPGYSSDNAYGAQPGYPPPGGYPPQTQPYPEPGDAPPPGYAPGAPPAVGVAAAPAPSSSGAGRAIGATLLGIAGVGSLGLGGYFTYKAHSNAQDLEKKYDPAKEDKRKTAVILSGVCYGLGGAAIVTAIIVAATGGSSGQVALAPVVGPDLAGATLGGSF